jgi:beta-lactamase regulating signal transducer with metallopeptidase domain
MEWLIYLLKVSACTGLFYAFYHFFLRKLTFFKLNRAYLILTLVLSFFIPKLAIEIQGDSHSQVLKIVDSSVYTSNQPNQGNSKLQLQAISNSSHSNFDWQKIILKVYLLVAAIVCVWFLSKVIRILLHARKVDEVDGRLRIIYKSKGFTNCSFFTYVFIDRKNLDQERIDSLLKHESIHALRLHSIDKLLVALCKSLLWFNPFIYLYGSAFEQAHEYDADEITAEEIGEASYAQLLLAIATNHHTLNIEHGFAGHPIKQRIKMLFTKKSTVMKKYSYLLSLPIVLGLVWSFGTQVVYASKLETPSEITSILKESNSAETQLDYNITELDRLSAYAGKIIESIQPLKKSLGIDTLRLVGLGMRKDVKVIIDGKKYDPSILTKIGPRCIKLSSKGNNTIKISTKDNKILYALEYEKENAKVKQAADKSRQFYTRYVQKNEDGSSYCVAMLRNLQGASAATMLSLKGKVFIMINDKHYREDELKALNFDSESVKRISTLMAIDKHTVTGAYPQYSKEYESVLKAFD